MPQDAFISYSSKDKVIADATCGVLEARGIRCWMAPRDILPGSEWGAAIVGAISTSKVMVLIYTSSSNASPQVRREVERAVARGLHVIPFRIEDVPMSPALEYFISSPHWLDAINPPVERHLDQLAKIIRAVLDAQKSTDPLAPDAGAESSTSSAAAWSHGPPPGAFPSRPVSASPAAPARTGSPKTKLMVGVGAAAVAAIGIVIGMVASRPGEKSRSAGEVPKVQDKLALPAPALPEPAAVVVKEPEKPAIAPPVPAPQPAPPPIVAAVPPMPKEPGDEDIKRFWELLTQGNPRIPRLQEALEELPQLVDRKNAAGNTPLFEAAKAGQARVVLALLESGADWKQLSVGGNTPLHGAALGGIADAQAVNALAAGNLDVKNADGRTPLQDAVMAGNVETVTLLLAAGANVKGQHKDGRSPLQSALALDDPAKAHALALALVAAGAEVDIPGARGNTPLHHAAESGDVELVGALIEHGAKVDRTGILGRTALHLAALDGKVDTVKILVSRKASVDVADDQGNTPLHLAATLKDTATAETLLAAGAKVMTSTKEKQTPLHVAAAAGNTAMVELFMRNGGAALLAGSKPSPVEVAEKAGKKDVVALLRKLEFPAMLQSAIKSTGPVSPKLLEMIRKDPKLADASGADGRNLLHQCAAVGNVAFAAELVKINPALVRAFSATEETTLHVAAASKQAGIAKVLVGAGAPLRATMRNGDTPLHVAAKAGAKDVAKVIVDAGADPAVTNKAGQIAAELAADEGTKSVLVEAEREAAPVREAWADLQLETRSFDVSAPGLTSPLRIRFRDRSNFTVEGELKGGFKSLAGTYTKGTLTLTMQSPDGMIFPTIPGTTYTGKIVAGVDEVHFGWRIGSVEISFDRP